MSKQSFGNTTVALVLKGDGLEPGKLSPEQLNRRVLLQMRGGKRILSVECMHCRTPMHVAIFNMATKKFCSFACRDHIPAKERLYLRIRKTNNKDDCWEWIGIRDRDGYGTFSFRTESGKREQRAHRVSWILEHGEIPDGLWVLHDCDNPPCCNPNHLMLGDNDLNSKHRTERGRNNPPRGERAAAAKLTTSQVIEIRRRAELGPLGIQRRLAKEFGVGYKAISKIVTGIRWAHV
jgi:hypothetical protein